MLIEQLSDSTVKYTLTPAELEGYGLDFETIGRYDANTRAMVYHLMLLAERQEGITVRFDASEAYVEALLRSDGDCIVYVSVVQHDTSRRRLGEGNSITCTTDSLDLLVRLSRRLLSLPSESVASSALYYGGGTFFLLLEPCRGAFERVLYGVVEYCEYSTEDGRGFLSERCLCLEPEDALLRLSLLGL